MPSSDAIGAGQEKPPSIHLPKIHVWRIPLAPALSENWDRVLSPEEIARADRFRFAPDRARWVRTRGIVRTLLGQSLHCPPSQVPLAYGPHGKPMLAPGACANPLYFNWSHTDDLALLALTERGEVGIDIERLRMDFAPLALAQSVFSPRELDCLRNASPDNSHALFFALWTAKEALLKAVGTGLLLPPADCCLADFANHATASALGMTVSALSFSGHVAALASCCENPHIEHHIWHESCRASSKRAE